MAVGLSAVNTANAFLNVLRGAGNGVTFTAPATVFCQLHTSVGDPGAAGTSNVSVGSATRNALTFNAAAAGSMSLTSAPSAWTNGGTSETISYISTWSASSAGTFYFSATLTTPQAWISTNTFSLTSLSVSLTPVAA